MMFASFVFYLFAAITLGSALMVISSRNPVYSVLFLILAFFNAAGLFVLIGAEYIAMTLVVVYVGAVAVLFLFVVMMLNINLEEMRRGFLHYLPLGAGVALLLLVELFIVSTPSILVGDGLPAAIGQPTPDPSLIHNTAAIGNILYTDYVYLFQLAGLILLVAMIGAIVLTLRHRPDVRRQNISEQINRKREDSVELIKVRPGEGV